MRAAEGMRREATSPRPSPAQEPRCRGAVSVLAVLLVVAATTPARSEEKTAAVTPVNLSGTVKERGTRTPLAGAEVSIVGRDEFNTTTDERGAFEFRGVPAGNQKLKIMLVEYEPAVADVEIAAGERTEAAIYLEKVSYTQYSTTVRGERVKQVVTRHVLEQEEIKKIPGTQGDTIKVVEVLPGVARTPFGLGGLLVFRGANSQGSSVFADGGPIPMLFHFGALRSVINSDLIEDLEFYPGNAGIYYSDVTGGVIDVKTRAPKDDRLHGKLDVNIYEGGFLVEGPIVKDLSFAGAFHRNWHDLVLNAVWPSDSPAQMTVAPVYYDYQFKLRWKADAKNTVDAFFFGSDDRMVIVAGKSEQSGMEFGSNQYFHKMTVAHTWKPAETITNTFTPTFMFLGADINVMTEYYVGDGEYVYGIRDDLNWRLFPAYQLNFGVLAYGGHVDLNLNMPHLNAEGEEEEGDGGGMPQGRGLDTVQDMAEVGGYTELVAEPLARLKLIPGLRFDWYSYVYKYSVDPRLAVRFKAADSTTLKAGAGTYHKRPMGPYIIKKYGNPDLDLEMSAQYSLGVEQNLTDLIRLDVTAFYIDMRDLVTTNPALNTTAGAVPYVNGGQGRSWGGEFMLKHNPGRWFSGWISYTISRSERKYPNEDWKLFYLDQTHIVAAVGLVKLPRNWQVGARFRLVSGIPTELYTERGGFNGDMFGYIPVTANMEDTRLPMVHTLDLRVDKTFVFDWWMLTVYLDVQNVYDNRNVEFTNWNYDFSKHDYVRGLPILPAIGLQAEF
ncbi:MAG: TonB-dependent receptor [Deltaproteobacteria bacterium]|nr:TonB-dependent receptor [Deltaproteobacteria bacterium]